MGARFEQEYEKYQNFYLKIFLFLVIKFSVYLNRRVFVMLILELSTFVYGDVIQKSKTDWQTV